MSFGIVLLLRVYSERAIHSCALICISRIAFERNGIEFHGTAKPIHRKNVISSVSDQFKNDAIFLHGVDYLFIRHDAVGGLASPCIVFCSSNIPHTHTYTHHTVRVLLMQYHLVIC